MAIKKILYPTKFRELAYNSLLELTELRKVGLEEVVLLHLIPREEVAYVPFGGYLKEKALELKESALLKFQEWAKELQRLNLKVKIYVEVGEILYKILEIADKEKVDLLVIGKKKTLYPWEGDLSIKIVERSKIPVLVYRRLVVTEIEGELVQRENVQIFKKPLLATDFSEIAQRAGHFLTNFSSLIEDICIVNVIKSGSFKDLSEEEISALERKRKEELIKEATFFEKQGFLCHTYLRVGEPSYEILELAREKERSLLVIGKSGKGLLEKFVVGSVSKALIKVSEFPLLIVP